MSARTVVLRGHWTGSAKGREFAIALLTHGLPPYVREHHFAAPLRQWALDLAWPGERVAVELEGSAWGTALCDELTGDRIRHSSGKVVRQPGRHTSGAGYTADLDKYNAAAAAQWKVLRFTWAQLETRMEDCRALLERALGITDGAR